MRVLSTQASAYEPPGWLAAAAALLLAGVVARQLLRTRPMATALPAATSRVSVEVVLFSVLDGDELGYRILTAPLPVDADPDLAALEVSGLDRGTRPPGCMSRATSWRRTATGSLVLTYCALPDTARPLDGSRPVALTAPSIVCSDDPLRPAPDAVHAHHVAAHGARHLAYLARTDPTVARCAEQAPRIWQLLSATASAPVAPHERAHALAEVAPRAHGDALAAAPPRGRDASGAADTTTAPLSGRTARGPTTRTAARSASPRRASRST